MSAEDTTRSLEAEFAETERSGQPPKQAPDVPEVVVNRGTQVEIERSRFAKVQAVSAAVLSIGGVLTLMYFAKPVLVVMLVSMLFAFMLAPIVDWGERLFRIPRAVGSLIAVLLMMGLLYGALSASYTQALEFSKQLPQYSGKIRGIFSHFQHRAQELKKTTETVIPTDQEDKNAVKVKTTTSWSDTFTRGASGLTELLLLASFVPFLVYFMLSWKEHVRTSTVMLFKMEHRNTAYVTLGLISSMVRGFIVGNLIIGVFLAIVSALVFWWMHLPYWYFIGPISGFLSLVPYLGPVLAVVPPVAAGIGALNSERIVLVVIAVFGLHLFALNVLYPKILGKRLQLNPLAVTIALLFWGWLWGAMGLILAVPLTGAMKIVFDHVEALRGYGAWLGE